jgi:hypothetical protein
MSGDIHKHLQDAFTPNLPGPDNPIFKIGSPVVASSRDGEPAVRAIGLGGGLAGSFSGDVEIDGDIILNGNIQISGSGDVRFADCAEQFDVACGVIEPGTVLVVTDDGTLCPSRKAYDKRVAGVVSGAGDYRPAMTLDVAQSSGARLPVAMLGKVYCLVDATQGPIRTGDLLTTSGAEGRAMTVADPAMAFGSVIGKALKSLDSGFGLIPILVALQ